MSILETLILLWLIGGLIIHYSSKFWSNKIDKLTKIEHSIKSIKSQSPTRFDLVRKGMNKK